jgi:hypothetical protein
MIWAEDHINLKITIISATTHYIETLSEVFSLSFFFPPRIL